MCMEQKLVQKVVLQRTEMKMHCCIYNITEKNKSYFPAAASSNALLKSIDTVVSVAAAVAVVIVVVVVAGVVIGIRALVAVVVVRSIWTAFRRVVHILSIVAHLAHN